MRKVINASILTFAAAITLLVAYAVVTNLLKTWGQISTTAGLSQMDMEESYAEMSLAFMFFALPLLGAIWATAMAIVRRR